MWVTNATGILPGALTPVSQSAYNSSNNRLVMGLSNFDVAGNLKTDASGNTYSYDANNLMTGCTVSGVQSSYAYDGNGNRITKTTGGTTTTFVYNVMGQLIAEYGGPTPTTGGTSYLTTDHLGSTRVITDSSATPQVLERDDYLPFGEQIGGTIGSGRSGPGVVGYSSSTDIHQKFTSKERDTESNLDYFGARYYSSMQGRFLGVDEGAPNGADPQTWNRYKYARNKPLFYVDPTGDADKPAKDQRINQALATDPLLLAAIKASTNFSQRQFEIALDRGSFWKGSHDYKSLLGAAGEAVRATGDG